MRYLSFNTIAKKECPGGQHSHKGYSKCHPIEMKHKEGTVPDRWHQEHGIATAETGIDGKKKDKPKKDDAPKKVGRKRDITPETTGVPKAPILALTKGLTAPILRERYGDIYKGADEITEALESFDGETGKIYTDLHEQFKEVGIEIEPELDKMYQPIVQDVANDMAGVIAEYPMGARGLKKIELKKATDSKGEEEESTVMFFRPSEMAINFTSYHYEDGRPGAKSAKLTTKYSQQYDPVLKKMADEWAFHPYGSASTQPFSHEYGHLEQQLVNIAYARSIRWYSKHPEDEPETIKQAREKVKEHRAEVIDGILEDLKEISPDIEMNRDWHINKTSNGIFITLYTDGLQDSSTPEWKKIKKYFKKKGYAPSKAGKKKLKYDNYSDYQHDADGKLRIRHYSTIGFYPDTDNDDLLSFDGEEQYQIAPLGLDRFNEGGSDLTVERMFDPADLKDENGYKINEYEEACKRVPQSIVKQCEELYKELYKVDTIIPSDVYTGYGYFAELGPWYNGDKYSSDEEHKEKVPERELIGNIDWAMQRCCEERIAEAYNDVMVRKDKANSMSVLIVACCEYELARCITGETESFAEFLRGNFDFDTAGEPITKSSRMRYILIR